MIAENMVLCRDGDAIGLTWENRVALIMDFEKLKEL